ncbi:MAG TPA: aldehyde dehydrogenase [Thermodesulfovibrionales bacterium]|nr:aldehyde dehydrogenase [Thermodesulfovibrionales bacterium]
MDAKLLYRSQSAYFMKGHTRPAEFRIRQCETLKQAVLEYEPQILAAVAKDMGRPETEAYTSEVMMIIKEVDHAVRHIRSWMKPRRVRTSLMNRPGKSYILPEPYGSALIIGPWNYPFQLLLCPLVGAIAAGNTAVLKISEIAEHSAKVISEMVNRYFEPEYIAAVQDGPEETQQLLDQEFDYIFFTGSAAVGKIIMGKAATRLTPVTLELGGKNPCIVTPETRLETAARRICWGKFFNAGQTCIAPDYILVQESIRDSLLTSLKDTLTQFYGGNIRESADYGRIINQRHFQRLLHLMEDQEVSFGGETHESELFIAPTLLQDVSPESPVMQEEIFGPLLPVLTYRSLDEAIRFVRSLPKPLALYVFSDDRATQKRILQETSSGSVNINETFSQITSTTLPFGGVGESGMGYYHGQESFRTFTHNKSVLHRAIRFDNRSKYAPYRTPLKYLKRVMRLIG